MEYKNNMKKIARELLTRNHDMDIYTAARSGENARLLSIRENWADHDIKDQRRNTALMYALIQGNQTMIELLSHDWFS